MAEQKKQTNNSSKDNQHIHNIVHPSACFLSTSLAVSVNRSSSITQSDKKSRRRDVLYVCADFPYYSCFSAF